MLTRLLFSAPARSRVVFRTAAAVDHAFTCQPCPALLCPALYSLLNIHTATVSCTLADNELEATSRDAYFVRVRRGRVALVWVRWLFQDFQGSLIISVFQPPRGVACVNRCLWPEALH